MNSETIGPLLTTPEELKPHLSSRSKKWHTKALGKQKSKADLDLRIEHEGLDGWLEMKLTEAGRPKKNKPLTRTLYKVKPRDEIWENRVWCVFAGMGFDEMSEGRQFTILQTTDRKPRQIDVFAKDDECALVIECKTKEKHGKKSIDSTWCEKDRKFQFQSWCCSRYGWFVHL